MELLGKDVFFELCEVSKWSIS